MGKAFDIIKVYTIQVLPTSPASSPTHCGSPISHTQPAFLFLELTKLISLLGPPPLFFFFSPLPRIECSPLRPFQGHLLFKPWPHVTSPTPTPFPYFLFFRELTTGTFSFTPDLVCFVPRIPRIQEIMFVEYTNSNRDAQV